MPDTYNLSSYYTTPSGLTKKSTSGGGSLGSSYTDYTDAYGGKPSVPDPTESSKTAISGSISNLANLYNLSSSVNDYNLGQTRKQYSTGLPNYQNMLNQSSSNITSLLKGQLNSDELSQLYQSAAERGVSIGGVGAANTNAALMRAVLLSSHQLQAQGESELTSAINRTPTTKIFDVNSYLTTPEAQQQSQLYANIYGSAASPSAAAAESTKQAKAGVNYGAGAAGGGVNNPAAPSGGGFPTAGTGGYGGGAGTLVGGSAGPNGFNFSGTGGGSPSSGAYSSWNDWNNNQAWNQGGGTKTGGSGNWSDEALNNYWQDMFGEDIGSGGGGGATGSTGIGEDMMNVTGGNEWDWLLGGGGGGGDEGG